MSLLYISVRFPFQRRPRSGNVAVSHWRTGFYFKVMVWIAKKENNVRLGGKSKSVRSHLLLDIRYLSNEQTEYVLID